MTLATSLRAHTDLPVGRAAVAARLDALGPAGFARELEPILAGAAQGFQADRQSVVVVASWVAHALAGGQGSRLASVGEAATDSLPFVKRVFGDVHPVASLARRGRLADGTLAVYGNLSGLPHCRVSHRYRLIVQQRMLEAALRHHHPIFIGRLLDQPWIRADDVVSVAARRPSIPGIVLAIATRDRWFQEARVRRAVGKNPFSPRPLYELARLGTHSAA